MKRKDKRDKSKAEMKTNSEETEAMFYQERKEVKHALRIVAAEQGHGSIGKVIREATKQFLDELKFDWTKVA